MIIMLISILLISSLASLGGGEIKYPATIIFTITMLCVTALIITGHIHI